MANSAKWLPNVQGTLKSWTMLNMSTGASGDNFNVSSHTDAGVGNWDANLTANFSSGNGLAVGCNWNSYVVLSQVGSTSHYDLISYDVSPTNTDTTKMQCGIAGELA